MERSRRFSGHFARGLGWAFGLPLEVPVDANGQSLRHEEQVRGLTTVHIPDTPAYFNP